MNADYDTRECNRLYDNCMKGHKGGITIATFFQMARDLANVDLKEMARERGKREEESTKSSKRIRDAALYTFVYHYTFAAKSKSLII